MVPIANLCSGSAGIGRLQSKRTRRAQDRGEIVAVNGTYQGSSTTRTEFARSAHTGGVYLFSCEVGRG